MASSWAFSQEDAAGQRDLYVAQIGTDTTLRVTQSDRGFVGHPAWSPDGQWLAFLRQYDQSRFDVVIRSAARRRRTHAALRRALLDLGGRLSAARVDA